LRASAVLSLLLRVALIGACGFATWRAIQIARADWAASAGTIQGFEQALRIDPSDPELVARVAVFRSENDDEAPSVDEELRHSARLNPLNSAVLMTLGLREELRGDRTKAEADLIRAAEVDHQFKPAWTLANYYFRAGEPEKSWVMLQHTLRLDPLGYDPTPVFELCWQEASQAETPVKGARQAETPIKGAGQDGAGDSADAAKIAAVVPPGALSIQYLEFLMRSHRLQAAIAAWPAALAATDAAGSPAPATVRAFPDSLAAAGRVQEAVKVWNELVEHGIMQSGRLNPAQGISIADADFRFPLQPYVFGWHLADIPGVFATATTGSLDLEISGDEPPAFQLLSTDAPLQSATRYRLVWKTDASSLSSPRDPGFSFQVVQQPGKETTVCAPLLSTAPPACEFTTAAGTGIAAINLAYARAQGTVRVSGRLHLHSIRLEIAR
jgi:pentatricopeptide repeat protein